MQTPKPEGPAAVVTELDAPPGPAADLPLEELIAAPAPPPEPALRPAGLRTARLVAIGRRSCTIAFRGHEDPVDAELAPELAVELARVALAQGDSVLVDHAPGETPVVVAVLMTQVPRHVHVKGEKIEVEAEQEIVLRVGRAALRLREDGDVELVGSRISAASRGLFRLVGRMLRLN